MGWLLGKAGAGVPSPDKFALLRDADGDGKADRKIAMRNPALQSPSGLAWRDGKLYVANHNAVLAFRLQGRRHRAYRHARRS